MLRDCSAPSELELDRDELEYEPAPATQHDEVDRLADPVADHEPLHIVDTLDRRLADRDDQVLGPQPGSRRGRALDHLDDLDAGRPSELARQPRRERPGAARDSEVRTTEPAFAHQRGDDRARGV